MDSSWNYKVLKQECGNGSICVCLESITVSSDSEEEAYDLQEPKVRKKNSGKVRDASSHTLKHESAKSISKPSVHNSVLMKKVTCPICQLKIPSVEIEAHADSCAEKAASSTDYASIIVDIPPCLVTSDSEFEDVELMQIQGYGNYETEWQHGYTSTYFMVLNVLHVHLMKKTSQWKWRAIQKGVFNMKYFRKNTVLYL